MFGSILFKIVRFFAKIWVSPIQIFAFNNVVFLPKYFFCVDQINAKYIFELLLQASALNLSLINYTV